MTTTKEKTKTKKAKIAKVSSIKQISKRGRKPKLDKRHDPTPRAERSVLVGMKSASEIDGIFIDVGHASYTHSLSVNAVKDDMRNKTNHTGLYWIKVDAGSSLDEKDILKQAKTNFKETIDVPVNVPSKRGRKPKNMSKSEVKSLIKGLDLNDMDSETKKKIQKFIKSSPKRKVGRPKAKKLGRPKKVETK